MDGNSTASPTSSPSSRLHHRPNMLNAVSFGFIATAVLFVLFLIMAIFERILRPHRPFLLRAPRPEELPPGSSSASQKPDLGQEHSYTDAVSVVMPGQDFPTCFAHPVPAILPPDRVMWPSHAESSEHSVTVGVPQDYENSGNVHEKGATSEKGLSCAASEKGSVVSG